MTRIVKIKNLQASADTYCGQEIVAGQYYTLEETEYYRFACDVKVQNHLSSDPAKILVNDGANDLDYLAGKNHLEGNDYKDEFNRIVTKEHVSHPDWYYSPHSLDWTTSKYLSLYNRKHDGNGIDEGTDAGDAWLKFYDASGTLLEKGAEETDAEFQSRLNSNCVKTVMEFEKEESYDVRGANLYIQNEPVGRAYLWCIFAPDIPYEYGGSKPFMGRGMNLQMMAAKIPHSYDAFSSSTINYDGTYHSGKIAAVIKHAVGEQIGIQIIFTCYEE